MRACPTAWSALWRPFSGKESVLRYPGMAVHCSATRWVRAAQPETASVDLEAVLLHYLLGQWQGLEVVAPPRTKFANPRVHACVIGAAAVCRRRQDGAGHCLCSMLSGADLLSISRRQPHCEHETAVLPSAHLRCMGSSSSTLAGRRSGRCWSSCRRPCVWCGLRSWRNGCPASAPPASTSSRAKLTACRWTCAPWKPCLGRVRVRVRDS